MNNILYTLNDIQSIFQISKPTMLKLVHSEGFPKIVLGKRIFIPAKALEKWCTDNTTYEELGKIQKAMEEVQKEYGNL